MNKGQSTKEDIIRKAAVLFNKHGFAGVSLSALMTATGLKKGGLYNHFSSKEEIMAEAFTYAFQTITEHVSQVIKNEFLAVDKLKAVVRFYRDYALNPIIEGGCPIINCTVEADNTNPLLRQKVRRATQLVIASLASVVQRGIERREFREEVDSEAAAIIIVAQLDGGILMARAFDDSRYMHTVCDQVNHYIDTQLVRA